MIGLNLATLHDHPSGLCSGNPGLYVMDESGWSGGVVGNSECRLGAWGGFTKSHGVLSITAGFVAGYKAAPVLPLLMPSIKINHFRLTYLPKSPGSISGGIHLSIEFNEPANSAGFSFSGLTNSKGD